MSTKVMDTTMLARSIQPGYTLPNGGLVLDVAWMPNQWDETRPVGEVLCIVGGGRWPAEFVTWAFVVDERGIVTVSGHYFSTLANGMHDLKKRSAR